jgi:hypothetical protein
MDWTVNFGVIGRKMSSANGLCVHGGMLTALEDPRVQSMELITMTLRRMHPRPRKVSLCGHSLGGGYAVVVGAHLFQKLLPLSRIITFGSPQVICSGQESNPIWKKMHQAATTLIYRNDIVPRSCGNCARNWMFELVPTLTGQSGPMIGFVSKTIAQVSPKHFLPPAVQV